MIAKCRGCGWRGNVKNIGKANMGTMFDIDTLVDACPTCGATNVDSNPLPPLVYEDEAPAIVTILKDYEDRLSDGYAHYCRDEDETLLELANEILEVMK